MKRKLVTYLVLLSSIICFSQNLKNKKTIVVGKSLNQPEYFDEQGNKISFPKYLERTKSAMLEGYDIFEENNKKPNSPKYGIYFAHKFGIIKPEYLKQIKAQLLKTSKVKIDSNQTIIIRYINNFSSETKTIEWLRSRPRNYSKSKAKRILRKQIELLNKSKNSIESKNDVKLFIVHGKGLDDENGFSELNWAPDTMKLKSGIFKISYTYHTLVLKPNGEYFISNIHLSNQLLTDLISEDDWSEFKKDWEKSYQSMSVKGRGVFKGKKQVHHLLCH